MQAQARPCMMPHKVSPVSSWEVTVIKPRLMGGMGAPVQPDVKRHVYQSIPVAVPAGNTRQVRIWTSMSDLLQWKPGHGNAWLAGSQEEAAASTSTGYQAGQSAAGQSAQHAGCQAAFP